LGGIHLEKAWGLGPQIGVYNGEWTLKLHRFCQAQGLDPFLTASLLGRILDGIETGTLSEEDRRHLDDTEDQGEKALALLRRRIEGGKKEFHLSAPPASENEDLDILADVVSFCMIVVNRLNLMTVSNIIDLIHSATGYALTIQDLQEIVSNIREMECRLQNKKLHWNDQSTLLQPGRGQISQILKKEEQRNVSITDGTAS
jgi:aldehyde:ferredoxin oxidoreductase